MMGTEARPKACAACGKRGVDLEVHHLVPRAVGGEAGPTCLLCRQCHDAVHQTDRGSVSIAELTRQAMTKKAARQEYTGGQVPYGWTLGADGVHLVADDRERRTIAAARSLREQGLSLRKVGEELAAEGMLPRSGGEWHAKTVRDLLNAEVA